MVKDGIIFFFCQHCVIFVIYKERLVIMGNFQIRITKEEYDMFNHIADISKARRAGLRTNTLPIPYRQPKQSFLGKLINFFKKIA